MATTENTYTGNGSLTTYSFTFPYLEESHVKVSLDGVDQLTTAYSFANATTINFNTAPGNGVAIRIYRQTDQDAPPATFFAGSSIRAQDLNDNFLQQLYVAQETDNIARNLTAGDIAPGAIGNTELADNSVTSAKIADSNVTTAKIANSSVTSAKIAEIDVSKLTDGSARQLLQTDAAGTGVEWTSNVDVPGTLDVTGAATFDSTVTIPSLNGGPLAGTRNLLINGNPTINQRGYVSGTATSGANQYTLDRWRVVVSGESLSWTDSNNVRTVTAPAGGVEQVIEGLNILSGTYTLSWTGTATATVDGSSVANGGQVTLTGGTNATVRFSSGTFSLAQLEVGTVATPFEHRSYGDELLRCQRYYYKTVGTAAFVLNINIYNSFQFPVRMRATPTVTLSPSGATLYGTTVDGFHALRSGSTSSQEVTADGAEL